MVGFVSLAAVTGCGDDEATAFGGNPTGPDAGGGSAGQDASTSGGGGSTARDASAGDGRVPSTGDAPLDSSPPASCRSDRECTPYRLLCDPATARCVACVKNDDCGTGTECRQGACIPPGQATCGDGQVQTGEECDSGAAQNGPGRACKADCTSNRCGDGDVGPGEACDDGNMLDDDACRNNCSVSGCGDGATSASEQCDDGNTTDDDACTNRCTLPICGDGILQVGAQEQCDDGAANGASAACTPTCANATCGDGMIRTGTEECDDGPGKNGAGLSCLGGCRLNVCGDGDRGPAEACDDGNRDPGDGCGQDCVLEGCGDGTIGSGEQCDDGNANNDDGCTERCEIPRCGDGFLQSGEACDDGNSNDSDACVTGCLAAKCGDGLVYQNVEQCDQGASNADTAACTSSCKNQRCGDGHVGPGEGCDDGNAVDTDTCTNACRTDHCGDKVVQTGEECDLGSSNSNTGACTSFCRYAVCGDGFVRSSSSEECDLGAQNSDSGLCTPYCTNAKCGDGLVQPALAEICDDGNSNETDGCNSSCQIPTCGNGKLDTGEACDLAGRAPYLGRCPTSCDPQRLNCTQHGVANFNTCNAYCSDTAVKSSSQAAFNHCCEASSIDPDCPGTYPFSRSWNEAADLSAECLCRSFGTCRETVVVDMSGINASINPPTCGPAVMVHHSSTPGKPATLNADLQGSIFFPGHGNVPFDITTKVQNTGGPDPTFIFVDVPTASISAKYSYRDDDCPETVPANVTFTFGEFVPDVVSANPTAPESPRIAGDRNHAYVAYRDVVGGAGQVVLVGGDFTPRTGNYYLSQPQWVQSFAPKVVSTGGANASRPALVVGKTATTEPVAHVFWIENGTSLRHAAVDNTGAATVAAHELHAGTGMTGVQAAALANDTTAMTWVESVGATTRIKFARYDLTGTAVGSIVDVTSGEGNVFEPSLSTGQGTSVGVVWIDTRGGQRAVYLQLFSSNGATLQGVVERVDAASQNPANPRISGGNGQMQWPAVLWTDTRDGSRSIYGKGLPASGTWVQKPDTRVSAPGADAHDVAVVPTNTGLQVAGWVEGNTGNTVRYGNMDLGMGPLSCSTETTSSLDIFAAGDVGTGTVVVGVPLTYGVWIRNGAVVAKQLASRAFRSPVCRSASENFCQNNSIWSCGTQTVVQACGSDGVCDPATVTCKPKPTCMFDLPVCVGNVAATCSADGHPLSGGTDCTSTGKTCTAGLCGKNPWLSFDFEDGTTGGFTTIPGYTLDNSATTGANGTAHSIHVSGVASDPADGTYLEFDGVQPTTVSYWARASAIDKIHGRFSLIHAARSDYRSYFWSDGKIRVYDGTGNYRTVPGTYEAGRWYHFELRNINWVAGGYDVYVDDVQVATGLRSYPEYGPVYTRIDLGNVVSAEAWFDEITLR